MKNQATNFAFLPEFLVVKVKSSYYPLTWIFNS